VALRIVYAGTPDFAVPALDALVRAGHEVSAVYTQPDRPAGRGRALAPSAVKTAALRLGVKVLQPETLRDAAVPLSDERPDVMVVAAYGLLLPEAILAVPRLGCINIHASLLPRWRGAAPVQRAILAGDAWTGVAIMRMEAGLDTGPVYATSRTPILADDTTGTLTARLAQLGAETLVTTLPRIVDGIAAAVPQSEDGVVYARKVTKAEARLDWSRPAVELERAVRAFVPWPIAETTLASVQLRIHAAEQVAGPRSVPGTVVALGPAGIDVATGEGVLRLTSVQSPGRGVVPAASFAAGHTREGGLLGRRFGDVP